MGCTDNDGIYHEDLFGPAYPTPVPTSAVGVNGTVTYSPPPAGADLLVPFLERIATALEKLVESNMQNLHITPEERGAQNGRETERAKESDYGTSDVERWLTQTIADSYDHYATNANWLNATLTAAYDNYADEPPGETRQCKGCGEQIPSAAGDCLMGMGLKTCGSSRDADTKTCKCGGCGPSDRG